MQYSTSEFETLFNRCFPPAMRMAMSLLHDEDEARDVVHEVFLKLWESKTKPDNPTAFIIRSVRNASLNRTNMLDTREKIRRKIALEPPPDDFDYEQQNNEVLSAITLILSPREQEVVDRIYSEGMSYKQAAENLGVSVAAINKNVVAALKKLRTHFKTSNS